MVLYGAAGVVGARGWDVLIGADAYSRQGVWLWKRDLELAGVDPAAIEWAGFERGVGSKLSNVLEAGSRLDKKARKVVAESERRTPSARGSKKVAGARS